MSLRSVIPSAATALLLATVPLAAPAIASEFAPTNVSDSDSIDSAVSLNVGTIDDPARYSVELEEDTFLRVDIPVGQRLHVAYRITPDSSADGTQVTAELIDAEGYLSDFDKVGTINEESTPEGLRSGFLVSDVMGPENRSYQRETLLRLTPTLSGDDDNATVELTLTGVPEVVDGGTLGDIDRPKMRYASDVQPVAEEEAEEVIEDKIAPGETRYHELNVGWMEAIDATATITDPADTVADEGLRFSMFNRIDEHLVVVGERELSADNKEPVTFGQRTPGHYKNAAARNKTRTTGFLDGPVTLAVTNTSDKELSYEVFAAARGEGLEEGATDPSFDAAAAAAEQEKLDPVEHEYHRAAGLEESVMNNPLVWVAGALVLAAVALAAVAAKRRR